MDDLDRHQWASASSHATSEGLVVYQRCAACEDHRLLVVPGEASGAVALGVADAAPVTPALIEHLFARRRSSGRTFVRRVRSMRAALEGRARR